MALTCHGLALRLFMKSYINTYFYFYLHLVVSLIRGGKKKVKYG